MVGNPESDNRLYFRLACDLDARAETDRVDQIQGTCTGPSPTANSISKPRIHETQVIALPEIIDQHQDTTGFIRLRVKNCSAVWGNRDVVIDGTQNCQDFRDRAGGEFVKADVLLPRAACRQLSLPGARCAVRLRCPRPAFDCSDCYPAAAG